MIRSIPTSGSYASKQTTVDRVLTADGVQIKPGSKFVEPKTLIEEGEHAAAEYERIVF